MPIKLNGSTSGYVNLDVPAVSGTTNLTLPLYGFGKVLQVVLGDPVSQTTTTSSTYVSSGMTATITPSSTSSRIMVFAMTNGGTNTQNQTFETALFRGTVAGTKFGTENSVISPTGGFTTVPFTIIAIDSPNTTSAQLYTLGFRVSGGTGYIHSYAASGNARMILVEVGP